MDGDRRLTATEMLERFNTEHKVDLLKAVEQRGTVVAVGESLVPKDQYLAQGVLWDETARALWAGGGPSNQLGLLKFAATRAGGALPAHASTS